MRRYVATGGATRRGEQQAGIVTPTPGASRPSAACGPASPWRRHGHGRRWHNQPRRRPSRRMKTETQSTPVPQRDAHSASQCRGLKISRSSANERLRPRRPDGGPVRQVARAKPAPVARTRPKLDRHPPARAARPVEVPNAIRSPPQNHEEPPAGCGPPPDCRRRPPTFLGCAEQLRLPPTGPPAPSELVAVMNSVRPSAENHATPERWPSDGTSPGRSVEHTERGAVASINPSVGREDLVSPAGDATVSPVSGSCDGFSLRGPTAAPANAVATTASRPSGRANAYTTSRPGQTAPAGGVS